MKKVDHITGKESVNALVKEMADSGVMGAGKLADSVDILEEMIKDRQCKLFCGMAGALIPGGQKEIIHQMLKKKWIDVYVTTGAMLTHDLIEATGSSHYQGDERLDDRELQKKGLDRMYDSLMSNKVYEPLEKFTHKTLKKLPEKEFGISDFLHEFGKHCPKNTILNIAYKKKIPVFCPALQDSGFGIFCWYYSKENYLKISTLSDLEQIFNLSWEAKKKGYLIVGGGVPKNHIVQAFQFSPTGGDYGVQITMDRPEHGGSSGAEPREAISWGKLKAKAKYTNLVCDATIALPIIYSALKKRV